MQAGGVAVATHAAKVATPLREQFVDIQRARVVSAMIEMCAQLGAANVTVTEVVRRAGVSRRTFYELFVDCEDCLLAALDVAIARAGERVREAHAKHTSWVARLRASLTALLEFLEEEPAMGSVLVLESFVASSGIRERRARVLAQVVRELEAGRGEKGADGQEPPSLASEWIAGAVLFVLHHRAVESNGGPLIELVNPLMYMMVLPYLGHMAARSELQREVVRSPRKPGAKSHPLKDLEIRLTYRTMRAVVAIGANPGSSNRQVGRAAGIEDPGQISKLLARLERLGLIVNSGGTTRGFANHWTLTEAGSAVRDLALTRTIDG